MNIAIVGGGPAGLYFALLMKKADPRHRVRVYEQNPAGATYGWGVVFSGRALAFLAGSDADSYADIAARLALWHDLHIGHRGEIVPIDGSTFSGIARLELLQILQRHCRRHGVELDFETRIDDPETLAGCDLLVGADGVNSMVRERWREHFQPALEVLGNRYIWYGTHRRFPALSLLFRENADGAFVAHTYPYSAGTSTFIVECDAATWEQAGLAGIDDAASRAYCERVFAEELQGQALLSNNARWLNFRVVSNRHWHRGRTVLLGDALRTVHFSIGSGTRTALEDAIALHAAVVRHPGDVPAALNHFEARRRPGSLKLQDIAYRSLTWYERFRDYLHLPPLEFAYSYMTRGGRVDDARLREQAPRFMAAYENRTKFHT